MKDKRILLIFITVFIDLVGFGILIPLNPYLAKEFGATPLQVGLLMGIYSLMQFVFSPLWGQLSDRIGRRPVILISLLGASLAHLGFAFSTSYNLLFLFRLLAGVFGGNLAAAMAYIADITDEKNRSQGMGLIGAAFGLGFILGPALGGVFADVGYRIGPVAPFGGSFPAVIASAICFLNFLAAIGYLPETLPESSAKRGREKKIEFRGPVSRLMKIYGVGRSSGMGILFLIYFLSGFALAFIEMPLFLYVQQEFQWSFSKASFGFAYIGLLMVFTQGFLIRKLIAKYGEKWVMPLGLLMLSLGLMGCALGSTPYLMAPFITLLAIGYGLANPSITGSISLLSPKESQGENLGVAQSLSSLARILGPVTGGYAFQVLFPVAPFLLGGVSALLGLLLCFMIMGKLRTT